MNTIYTQHDDGPPTIPVRDWLRTVDAANDDDRDPMTPEDLGLMAMLAVASIGVLVLVIWGIASWL